MKNDTNRVLFAMLLCTFLAAAALVGETSHPADSFFAWKREAKLTLKASGFAPNEVRPLTVRVLDHEERETAGTVVAPKTFTTDAKGEWAGVFDLPTGRLGCFKVCAASGDVKLPKLGTRGEGYLTYAVVHDYETRPRIPHEDAFFGCYGDPKWLGCRHCFARYIPPTNTTWRAWPGACTIRSARSTCRFPIRRTRCGSRALCAR